MQHKMIYRGYEIKIWAGNRGLGSKHNSYLAQTVKPPIITVRRNDMSMLKHHIKHAIDEQLYGE